MAPRARLPRELQRRVTRRDGVGRHGLRTEALHEGVGDGPPEEHLAYKAAGMRAGWGIANLALALTLTLTLALTLTLTHLNPNPNPKPNPTPKPNPDQVRRHGL